LLAEAGSSGDFVTFSAAATAEEYPKETTGILAGLRGDRALKGWRPLRWTGAPS
jgi:hypothetical protein